MFHHLDKIHDHLHHHALPTESDVNHEATTTLLEYDVDHDGFLNSEEYARLQQRDHQNRHDTLHQHHQWSLEHVRDKHTLSKEKADMDAANERGLQNRKHAHTEL